MARKILSILFILLCSCNSNKPAVTRYRDKINISDFYSKYSKYTDPGEYAHLYKSLPDSLAELCELIKCQLIHSVDIGPYRDIIPPDRHYEDPKFPTAEKLLAGLQELDSTGLTFGRKSENRLVVTCRYHSILGDAWLRYQKGEIGKSEKYGVGGTWADYLILDMLCHDMASILGQELLYWEHPDISKNESMDIGKLEKEKVKILDKISVLLKNPDDHLNEIKDLYDQYDYLQYDD